MANPPNNNTPPTTINPPVANPGTKVPNKTALINSPLSAQYGHKKKTTIIVPLTRPTTSTLPTYEVLYPLKTNLVVTMAPSPPSLVDSHCPLNHVLQSSLKTTLNEPPKKTKITPCETGFTTVTIQIHHLPSRTSL